MEIKMEGEYRQLHIGRAINPNGSRSHKLGVIECRMDGCINERRCIFGCRRLGIPLRGGVEAQYTPDVGGDMRSGDIVCMSYKGGGAS